MSGQNSPFPTQMPQLALQHFLPPVQTLVPQGTGVSISVVIGLAATREEETRRHSQVMVVRRRVTILSGCCCEKM